MAITARDYQSTALNRPAAAATGERPRPERDPDRIGVVFVHGIGTQQPAETFLDWSAPIVRILEAWRAENGFAPDPVVRAQFSFAGGSQPYLELDVPEIEGHPGRRFVITEAWWAAQIRPPSLGDAVSYIRRGFPRILAGIRDSYEIRGDILSTRVEEAIAAAEAEGRDDTPAILELKRRRGWAWIDAFDAIQRFLSILAYVPALAIGSLFLLAYAPFRLIPIKAIRDVAVLRSVDNFLTTWFGDLPDILDDPVQAANVRSRLAESVDRLVTQMGCGSIAIVAHSGGAIVSFTTLLDPAYWRDADPPLRVQRLITIGEGLQLGWRLHDTGAGRTTSALPDRLTGDLVAAQPELRWTDVWASYDPAPAGPIVPPQNVKVPDIDSRPITNRMSILEDHGGYWSNDEGFLVPLVRYLDQVRGDPNDSRFFRDGAGRLVRIERRRQRVAVLAAWRWIAALGAVVPILGSTVASFLAAGVAGPAVIGRDLGTWFERVPLHEIVTAPLAFLGGVAEWPDWFGAVGRWAVGSVAIALLFLVIGLAGGALWGRWDGREREVARHEPLGPVRRWDMAVAWAVMTLVAIAASAWIVSLVWA